MPFLLDQLSSIDILFGLLIKVIGAIVAVIFFFTAGGRLFVDRAHTKWGTVARYVLLLLATGVVGIS